MVKELHEKYKPDGIVSLADRKIELNQIRTDSNEDPTKRFDRIKTVETKFNTKTKKINQEELIVVVLT